MCNTTILDAFRQVRYRPARVVRAIHRQAAKSVSDTLHVMRRHHRHPALVALISLIWLLAAVLPSMSHAWMMQQARTNVLNELPSGAICSAVNAETQSAPADAPTDHLDHCGVCLPHAGATGVPPVLPSSDIAIIVATEHLPPLYLQAPRPLFAWATPAPRGPPQA